MPYIQKNNTLNNFTVYPADLSQRGDRIYFLNTGGADAILIESEGKYALIDAAEDSDNPRGFPDLVYDGTEEYVCDAVKRIAGNENGEAVLEFVLGTHSHSDHIGGFDTLILDEKITVKTAYLKEYDESRIRDYEIEAWDNKEVYEQMVNACSERGVPIISDISEEPFTFGNFTLKFCNTEITDPAEKVGENENAVGLLIEKGSLRAFLAADINNLDGDEDRLAAEIGKVDLLKVGHHGYDGSTTRGFAQALSPEISVVTNKENNMNKETLKTLNEVKAAVFETGAFNGIIAEFGDNEIKLYGELDSALIKE